MIGGLSVLTIVLFELGRGLSQTQTSFLGVSFRSCRGRSCSSSSWRFRRNGASHRPSARLRPPGVAHLYNYAKNVPGPPKLPDTPVISNTRLKLTHFFLGRLRKTSEFRIGSLTNVTHASHTNSFFAPRRNWDYSTNKTATTKLFKDSDFQSCKEHFDTFFFSIALMRNLRLILADFKT
jgi:hypothetical protein